LKLAQTISTFSKILHHHFTNNKVDAFSEEPLNLNQRDPNELGSVGLVRGDADYVIKTNDM
jgi:hypothetical protein